MDFLSCLFASVVDHSGMGAEESRRAPMMQ